MSVSRCIGQALRIAEHPRVAWKALLEKLPEACPHAGCTGAQGCRERVAEYLRVQYSLQVRREARTP